MPRYKDMTTEQREAYLAQQRARYWANIEESRRYKREKARDPERQKKQAARKRERRAEVAADPARRLDAMDRYAARTYKVRVGWYKETLACQDGGCAVCGGVNENGKPLFVDHDHTTGAVRGLLCTNCNAAVGHVRDSAALARGVAAYLERHGNA